MSFDPHDPFAFRRHHLGRALARVQWMFDEQFLVLFHARGFEDFKQADVSIIARLPVAEGARITELAQRIGISKQAVGKLVDSLTARGYVERTPDPDDGRAQRVRYTPRGREALATAGEVVAELEAGWAEVLGADELSRLKTQLLRLADALGPPDYL